MIDEQRREAKRPNDRLVLLVVNVGEYGEHAVARRAGFRVSDILISFDGRTEVMSESAVLAHAVQRKRPGDEVSVVVLRNGEEKTLRFAVQ